ncbi:MAG: rhomboid family intramembrane serine protease [Candidatus Bathyarchaeia archaeon]|nr:rhomboid family intramembrane serine protease [Candidatus Bathyarchaeota archaeon]
MLKKTTLLILLSIIATIIHLYLHDSPLTQSLYFSGENLARGYFWTPVTSIFIHASMVHLVGNMLFLYVFGRTLEKEVGSARMLLAFFLGGILSFITSLYFYGHKIIMVGASAAIFTLIAIVMLIKPLKFSLLFLMPLGLVAILYFIYNVLAALFLGLETNVGYIPHLIGFIIGIPFGIAWSRGRWKRNLLITLALLILYLIISGLLFALIQSLIFQKY